MVDALQAKSSIPLPGFQTEQAGRDPLPINSPKDIEKTAAASVQTKGNDTRDQFADYLNQSSITTVEKVETGRRTFDPAGDIVASSAYGQPGGKTPF